MSLRFLSRTMFLFWEVVLKRELVQTVKTFVGLTVAGIGITVRDWDKLVEEQKKKKKEEAARKKKALRDANAKVNKK